MDHHLPIDAVTLKALADWSREVAHGSRGTTPGNGRFRRRASPGAPLIRGAQSELARPLVNIPDIVTPCASFFRGATPRHLAADQGGLSVTRSISRWRLVAGSAVLVLLTACGGGGSDTPSTPLPPATGQQPPPGATPLSGWKVDASSSNGATASASEFISFKATGVGTATRITWDFGDGSAPIELTGDVTYAYVKAGDFVVTATVTGQAGDQQVATTKITVWPKADQLMISQSVDPQLPLLPGARVRFAASVVVPNSSSTDYRNPGKAPTGMTYRWTFSDGATGDTAAMVRSFDAAGSYDVELTGTDRFGRKISAKRTLVVSSLVTPTMLQTNLGGPGSMNYGPLSLLGNGGHGSGSPGMVRDKAGNTFILDGTNRVIRKITPDGVWSDFAGASGVEGLVDGTGSEARLRGNGNAMAIAADDTIYFADGGVLRSVNPKGEVTTFDRVALAGGDVNVANTLYLGISGLAVGPDGSIYATVQRRVLRVKDGRLNVVAGSDEGSPAWVDGPVASARFGYLNAVAVRPNGDVLVSDSCYGVRRIGTDGQVSAVVRFAGQFQTPDNMNNCSSSSGPAMTMATDGSTLLIWEGSLRVIDKDNAVRTVATNVYGNAIVSVNATTAWTIATGRTTVDWIRLDYGTSSTQFGRSSGTNDGVVPFAGTGTEGVAPQRGIAMDESGNVVFAYNGSIHRYQVSSHSSLPAVVKGSAAMTDGPSGNAVINWAGFTATDAAGNILFTDYGLALRRRDVSNGSIRTLAGSATSGTADGAGAAAKFSNIVSLAVTAGGTAYLIDDYSRLVRVSPTGQAVTIMNFPERLQATLAVTPAGDLLIARDSRVFRLESDNSLTVLGGTKDTGAPRASRLISSVPDLLVSPDGKIYVVDELSDGTGRRALRRLESTGVFTDIAQDGPMAMKLFVDRDPLELAFSFSQATFRPDGKLMLFAGQPHSWWLLDGLR